MPEWYRLQLRPFAPPSEPYAPCASDRRRPLTAWREYRLAHWPFQFRPVSPDTAFPLFSSSLRWSWRDTGGSHVQKTVLRNNFLNNPMFPFVLRSPAASILSYVAAEVFYIISSAGRWMYCSTSFQFTTKPAPWEQKTEAEVFSLSAPLL